jgi:hypothetical protein
VIARNKLLLIEGFCIPHPGGGQSDVLAEVMKRPLPAPALPVRCEMVDVDEFVHFEHGLASPRRC